MTARIRTIAVRMRFVGGFEQDKCRSMGYSVKNYLDI
jgi:hypothetical protein